MAYVTEARRHALQPADVEFRRAGVESAARLTWISEAEWLLSIHRGVLDKRYAAPPE